ncbi:MAG: hypothetical protein AB7F40_07965 [Victivallaceae bacterium]|nr:hypothetical protein [Victivallaceae bacterium]
MDWSIEEEIDDLRIRRPHLVILGAGASLAALPDGDLNGYKLPLMKNFASITGIDVLLREAEIPEPYDDFEALYSDIIANPALSELTEDINTYIDQYFSKLELPTEPTLYDLLVLSLRPKDVIATFNWDPFLTQAVQRNLNIINGMVPQILFLHGNVTFKYCSPCKKAFPNQNICPYCNKSLSSAPLLYPIKNKNYANNQAISAHWNNFKNALNQAFCVTILGYGAPKTDIDAIEAMKAAWGTPAEREFEQIEIIDVADENIVHERWREFIHSHHYDVKTDFKNSYIARYPRRSCEALWNRLMECKWFGRDGIDVKQQSWSSLYESILPRIYAEHKKNGN